MNAAGLFYSREKLFFKVGVLNNWWNYFNLGNKIAQSEINLDGTIGLNFSQLLLEIIPILILLAPIENGTPIPI
ncbi:MAG: hypothetical protein R2779_08615 [Crocinitomicaceae bacterium]